MKVKFIHCTPDAEAHMAYCARVSSSNQDNEEYDKLFKYLIKHKHWSPFEMSTLCVEIVTTRAISPQLLRHRSFSFQEFSLRYAQATEFAKVAARRQDLKNKQNSTDDMSEGEKSWFDSMQTQIFTQAESTYNRMIEAGYAKEVARNILPLGTVTKLYMHGNIRSWITYLQVRTDKSTQLEHREIAEEIKKIFIEKFPSISKGLEWL